MVQKLLTPTDESEASNYRKLDVVPLSGVDLNDASARLKSREDTGGDNIFEILPRFSISGADNGSWESQYSRKEDRVLGVTCGEATGIAVGCDLISFEKDDDVPKQIHFSATIDFVVWRRSIVLLGLSNSEIVLVDPGPFIVKHKWKLNDDLDGKERYYVDAFIHSTPDPTKIDVVVVSVNGLVCRFWNISLSDGTLDATHDQNVSLDIDLNTVKDIQEFEISIQSEIVSVSSPSGSKMVILEKCGQLTVLELRDDADDVIPNSNIPTVDHGSNALTLLARSLQKSVVPKKVVSFDGELFILLSNGVLEILLLDDVLPINPGLNLLSSRMAVYDFKLILNGNEGTVKLWVLFGKMDGSDHENYVGIYRSPDFSQEFVFQLPALSDGGSRFKFASNVSPLEEPSTIIEFVSAGVRMYHVLETSTDITLQKLLSRGKYAEAHNLALNYKKDLDIVRKAEARDKLNKVIAYLVEGKQTSAESEYSELLCILRSITDAEFICQFCVQASIQKVDWIKEVLGLGKGMVPQCPNTTAAKSLLLTLKKFYTFELVYPSGTIHDWNIFVSSDNTMFLQTTKFLQSGNFEKCWRTLYHSFPLCSTIS